MAIFLLLPSGLFAQETPQGEEVPEEGAEPLSFRDSLLRQDILTMDYFALRQELSYLGLGVTGSRDELRDRLLDHLGLPPHQAASEAEKVITIKSARDTGYFIDENNQEGYIRFTGGVMLSLLDRVEDVIHEIEAQEILFNRDQELVTALGDVRYKMIRSDSQEEFTGSSLTFSMETWSGAFFDGISKRDRSVEGQGLSFSFAGDVIRRTGEDVIILYDGMVTSSKVPDPYYSIRAKKIWVFAPGEWGLENAFLFIGRVPVFYFPFFFQPGDEMFFNPSLSISPEDRRGNYLQTTTYLYGKKSKASSPLSFLQIADSDEKVENKEIRGLYLVRAPEKKEENSIPENWLWKVVFDSYTKMGFFLGTEWSLPSFSGLSTFKGNAGIGLTWTQYNDFTFDPGALDIGLWPWEQGVQNTSFLFGQSIPFRYGAQLELGFQGWNLFWEYYSDPYYKTDFWVRTEDFSPFYLLGFGDPPSQTSRGAGTTSLSWRIKGPTQNFNNPILRPYISQLSLSSLELAASWEELNYIDPDPLVKNDDSPSPMEKFFGLSTLTWPTANFNLTGNLLSWDSAKSSTAPESVSKPGDLEIIPPWETKEPPVPEPEDEQDFDTEQENTGLERPLDHVQPILEPPFSRISIPQSQSQKSTVSIPYSISPRLLIRTELDNQDQNDPRDYELKSKFSFMELNYTGNLTPEWNFSDSLVTVTSQSTYSGKYYQPFLVEEAFEEDENIKAGNNRNFTFSQNFKVNTTPLKAFPYFSSSNIVYALNTQLFQWVEEYDNSNQVFESQWTLPSWEAERISAHSITTSLTLTPFLWDTNLLSWTNSYTINLDPRPMDQDFTSTLNSTWGSFSGSLSTDAEKKEDEQWSWSKINASGTYKIDDWFTLKETLIYDLEEQQFTSLVTNLDLWALKASLNISQATPYEFDILNRNWIEVLPPGERALIPTSLTLSHNYDIGTLPFWKNRYELSLSTQSSYNLNIQQFTNNQLNLTLNLSLKLAEGFDFTLASTHSNQAIYRYFPFWMDQLLGPGQYELINPVEDLLWSFQFWDEEARRRSNFNLSTISLTFNQRFQDWDFNITYSGSPSIDTQGSVSQWEWFQTLKIGVQWKPIPEIKTDLDWVEKANTLEIKTQADS